MFGIEDRVRRGSTDRATERRAELGGGLSVHRHEPPHTAVAPECGAEGDRLVLALAVAPDEIVGAAHVCFGGGAAHVELGDGEPGAERLHGLEELLEAL